MEAESDLRQQGKLPGENVQIEGGFPLFEPFADNVPVCFVRAMDFRGAMGEYPGNETRLRTLQEQHNCPSFTPWTQGFGPREHMEMRHLLEEREERRRLIEEERAWKRSENRRHLFEMLAVVLLAPAVAAAINYFQHRIEHAQDAQPPTPAVTKAP